jgi:hypothetical protein
LCCNGVLFRDVELQPGDDEPALRAAGLAIERLKTKTRFSQPCATLCADNTCRIYARRPQRCREFDCAQLRAVQAGTIDPSTALLVIGEALRLVEKVKRLLSRLGDDDTQLPLSRRFQRTTRRLERALPDEDTAATYADLTLAAHELNTLLHAAFHVQTPESAPG